MIAFFRKTTRLVQFGHIGLLCAASIVCAFYSLLTRGVGFNEWIWYGPLNYAVILNRWEPHFAHSQYLLYIKSIVSPIMLVWAGLVSDLFSNPIFYLVTTIFTRIIFFGLIYSIANRFIKNSFFSIIATIAIACAQPRAFGFTLSDPWGALSFDHHHMEVLLFVAGFSLIFRQRILLGSVAVALSFHFHPLNSLVSYGFTVIPFLFVLLRKADYKTAAWVVLLPAISICFFVYNSNSLTDVTLAVSDFSARDWYSATLGSSSGVRDNSPLYNFITFAPFLIPVLLASLSVSSRSNESERYPIYIVLVMISVSIAVEVLHRYGIFMGELSVLCTVFAVHRGFWVVMIFSVIVFFKMVAVRNYSSDKALFVLSLLMIIHLIINTVTSSLVVAAISMYISRRDNNNTTAVFALFITAYSVYILAFLGCFGSDIAVVLLPSNERLVLTFLIFIVFSVCFVKDNVILRQYYIILFSCLLLSPSMERVLANAHDVRGLVAMRSISVPQLLVEFGYDPQQVKFAEEAMNAAAPYGNSGSVLAPDAVDHYLAMDKGIPLYVSIYDVSFVFNRKYGMDLNSRLGKLFGKTVEQVCIPTYPNNLAELISELDDAQLKAVMKREGITAALVSRERKGFKTVFSNKRYFVICPDT